MTKGTTKTLRTGSRRSRRRLTHRVAALLACWQICLAIGSEPLHRLYHQFQDRLVGECGGGCCQHSPPAETSSEGVVSSPRANLQCFAHDCQWVKLSQQRILSARILISDHSDDLAVILSIESIEISAQLFPLPWEARGPPRLTQLA
jgi:hypothetical protein